MSRLLNGSSDGTTEALQFEIIGKAPQPSESQPGIRLKRALLEIRDAHPGNVLVVGHACALEAASRLAQPGGTCRPDDVKDCDWAVFDSRWARFWSSEEASGVHVSIS